MAARKAKSEERKVEPLDKIANLLALLATKDASAGDQITALSRVGFTAQELAELLDTTVGNINQTNYLARQAKKKGANKKRKEKRAAD